MKEIRVWLLAAFASLLLVFSFANISFANGADGGSGGDYDDDFSQFYAGITGGASEWNLASDTQLTAVDEDDSTIGGLFGYRINKFIGFEVSGNYFGEPDYLEVSDVKVYDYGLGLNLYLPLGALIEGSGLDFLSLFAKGGVHFWHFQANDNSGLVDYDDDGTDWLYGFGINVDLNRHLAFRAEHNEYALDIANSGTTIDTNCLTVIIKF